MATALAVAPDLLVLDEPTFGQDLRTWGELVGLLAGLRDEGRAVVVVTHDADLVATLADRRLVLDAGRVVSSGSPYAADPALLIDTGQSCPIGYPVSASDRPSPTGSGRPRRDVDRDGAAVRLLEPLGDPRAPLARRNPVAKLAASALLTFVLLVALDPVTSTVAIGLELAAAPGFGIGYRPLARRGWPLLVSALAIVVFTLAFPIARGGGTLLAAGPVLVTRDGLVAALGLALRIFAVALPGLMVFATTDPTDLADSLIQQVRVPARFAIGALAAFRLVPLLADEWELLVLARRARGVDAGRNPAARARLFASTMFALLVGAIRRGTRLATAMDARGFDSGVPRSHARQQRFAAADAGLIAGAAAVAALAIGVSLAAGTFRTL